MDLLLLIVQVINATHLPVLKQRGYTINCGFLWTWLGDDSLPKLLEIRYTIKANITTTVGAL